MKTKLLVLAFLLISVQLLAQNPLVGTWKVVSIKATDTDGTKISGDGSQFKEIKIITPTHYMLFTQRKQGDSLVFDKAIAGTVRVEGDRYIETPLYSSQEEANDAKVDFRYRLQGDKFIQSGTITYPDGKKATLDELVFQKVKSTKAYPANPAIGTWNQLSSSGVNADGQKWSHTNATHIRFMTISPTHYVLIRLQDNKFESALAGTYKMEGNKFVPNFEMSSDPQPEGRGIELTQRVEANKLYWSGVLRDSKGEHTWMDVFEKVDSKTPKTASK